MLRLVMAALRRPAVKTLVRRVVQLLRWLAPVRPHVVVSGYPDAEGNAVEVVRALVARGHDVRWLVDALGEQEALRLLDLPAGDGPVGPVVLRKRSGRGFAAYLTARAVFFTHGLYLSPPPPRRKPVVNLWHGDGPKTTVREHVRTVRATYLVSGTALFGRLKADALAVPAERLLVVGNPRWDQLRRPASDAELRALGLDPARPLLVYLPTFRRAVAVGARHAWSDVTDEVTAPQRALPLLARAAAGHGVQVAVKPHPLDAEEYDADGAITLTQQQLDGAGVPLYRLLGRVDGLVTDYSSVWTDFLVLDRPIGFAVGDLEDYRSGSRGLDVELADVLPGPPLLAAADFEAFVACVVAEPPEDRLRRAAAARRIGLAPTEGSATDRLLAELARRGVL